jgi:hypothetical protein
MESSFSFVVEEPVDVFANDGATVIGRILPGEQHQGLTIDEHWVTMSSPDGSYGYVPAARIRWDVVAVEPPPPPPPPPPSPVAGAVPGPTAVPVDPTAGWASPATSAGPVGTPATPPSPAMSPAPAAAPGAAGLTIRRPVTLASGAAITLSLFMPWIPGANAFDIVLGAFLNISWDGPPGGIILLLCGVGIMALALTQDAKPAVVRLLGLVVLAAAASVILQTLGSDFLERVSVGLYVAVAGGVAALVAPSRDA